MKKINTLSAAVCLIAVSLLFSSCADIFNLFGSGIDAKTVVLDQTYSASAVTGVSITLVSESLDIVSHAQPDFRVVIESNLTDEDYYPIVTIMNDTFKILDQTKNIPLGTNYDCSVKIYVPEGFTAVSTDKGWTIETVSGYIDAQTLSAPVVNLESSSGYITVTDISTSTLNVNTVSGSVSITGKSGAFAVYSTSGSVAITLSQMFTSNSSIQTISGSIDVGFPENDGFVHAYETTSGSVKNSFTGLQTSGGAGSITYKTAAVSLTTKSTSGSVKVSKK